MTEAPLPTASAIPSHGDGSAALAFRRSGERTVLAKMLARSPLRVLTPKNHGDAAWAFLSTFGGGMVDGDRAQVSIEVEAAAFALVGTQASTKVYRSPRGCEQRTEARVAAGGALVMLPDPVVCFAGARYMQSTHVDLAPDASLVLLDGYTAGRSARGEQWAFDRYASRTRVAREGAAAPIYADGVVLDPRHGPIAPRMGRFESFTSLVVLGARFATVREAALACAAPPARGDEAWIAASPLGDEGVVLRVAAVRFEIASARLRHCFEALASVLGDNPVARKW